LTATHLEKILEIEPELLATDLHPDYLSSRYAEERPDLPALTVQHHHAHIVSVLAENGAKGPVIGIALDGTGLGDDKTIWGGEVLVADLTSYQRAAHLQHAVMPGGDAAARNPWRMALSYLYRCYGRDLFDLDIPFVMDLEPSKSSLITQMVEKRINSPLTSSCGRLFDSVSALLGICRKNRYEGQAAVELEMAQDESENGGYEWEIKRMKDFRLLMTDPIIQAIVCDLEKGLSPGIISRRFHNTMIEILSSACAGLRDEIGINEVALSGGVFQNKTLLRGLTHSLQKKGFRVFTHSLVPTNDGGISLGQALCAALIFNKPE
jgi:hydrogenase maturation protein HypF